MAAPSPTPLLQEITSIPIYVATLVESIINIINIFTCIYLITKLRKTRLMHVNLKTMLVNYYDYFLFMKCELSDFNICDINPLQLLQIYQKSWLLFATSR